jgi:hypothetical protein
VTGVWSDLLPLALASMVVPFQWMVTILLVRAPGGRLRALVFLLGNVAFRLAQGALFAYLVPAGAGSDEGGASPVVSWLLLVVGVLLLVKAARTATSGAPDDDAPPPRWIESASSMSTGRAFVLGAGMLAIGAKFWVFTMTAVAAIEYAGLSPADAALSFVLFALAAVLPSLLVVGITVVVPTRSATMLDAASAWLTRNTARIVLVVCLVVGTWFVVKALTGLGVL